MAYEPGRMANVLRGEVNEPYVFMAAAGAIAQRSGRVLITAGSGIAMTIPDPKAGDAEQGFDDGKELVVISSTAFGHTLVAPSGFNGSGTTATFSGSKGDNIALVAINGKWFVKSKVNVTLS